MSNDDFTHDDAPKSGGCLKWFLIIAGVGTLAAIIAAVVVGFLVKNWFDNNVEITDDPARAKVVAGEIVDMQAFRPAALEPAGAFKMDLFGVFAMEVVAFGTADGGMEQAPLFVGRMSGEGIAQDPDAALGQVRTQVAKMQAEAEIVIKASETRVIDTPDGPVEFTFAEGERANDGVVVRQISGAVVGGEAVSILFLSLPEEDYDEAVVLEALRTLDFVGVEPGEGVGTLPDEEQPAEAGSVEI
ncbi:MAG: hypothetical protein AAF532_13850 [Planctomycetota bacterium]